MISDLTQGSSSTEALPSSAEKAAADEILPRAHAACPRTNGAGSESASESTGTASDEPQLPSATETFRAMPARPARRIADPRVNDSHASSESAVSSSSVSGGPSVPECEVSATDGSGSTPTGASPGPRAAYEGSEEASENLQVNGHTSWEVYRLTCYVVPLATGRRTVRPRRR
jgi:hypothetical protein